MPYKRNRRSEKTSEQRAEEAAALRQGLEDKIKELTTSEGWLNWLHFQSKFRRYSVNNQMLIYMQRPDAAEVAGYTVWPRMGRQVREGSEAIWIYSPPLRKKTGEKEIDKRTGEEVDKTIGVRPKLQKVYAFEDTDPIPGAKRVFTLDDRPRPQLLEGEEEADIYWALKDWLEDNGWEVGEEEMAGSLNGYTRWHPERKVAINQARSANQKSKTMIHECAHVVLEHGKDMADYHAHRGFAETMAESVAYVVAGLFGFDTSAYSVHYVNGWAGGDPKVLKECADAVLETVNLLVKVLDVGGAPARPSELFDEDTQEANVAAGKEASKAYFAAKKAAQADAAPAVPAGEAVTV